MVDSPTREMSRSPRKTKADATSEVISMLEENMRYLEDMEEEKLRMQREHEEDKERLQEQMEEIVTQYWEHKRELEAKIEADEAARKRVEEEKERACQEMARRRREFEQETARMKEEMALRQAERHKLEAEKEQLTRQMEQFRVECEERMAKDKAEAARRTEELARQWEEQHAALTQRMADEQEEAKRHVEAEKERARREMAQFRLECEQELVQETARMEEKMAQFRAERGQLETEKQELTRQMESFRVECEERMAQEKEEAARLAEELARQWEEQRSDLEARMAEEQELARSEMMHFREVCEREMAEEKEEMSQRMSQAHLECSRLEEEKLEMLRRMEQARAEFDKEVEKAKREKEDMARTTADFQAECERQMQEKEMEIVRKSAEIRAEYEKQVSEEKERAEKLLAEARRQSEEQMRDEYDRLAREQAEMTKSFADFRGDCERKMALEKTQMEKQTSEFYAQCQEKMGLTEAQLQERTAQFHSEREQMAEEKAQLLRQMDEFRADCERKMKAEEQEMLRRTEHARADFDRRLAEEKALMTQKAAELHKEREQMAQEKAQMVQKMDEFRAECEHKMKAEELEMQRKTALLHADFERKLADEKAATEKKAADFFSECQQKMAENEAQMTKKSSEFRRERQRMAEEKADMTRKMEDFRTECERKMAIEEKEAKRKAAEYRAECQQQVAREKAAAERRIAEAREHTEEQLRTEREVTEHIKVVLRELPPLQAAMELGDLSLLEEELWKWRGENLPDRFGDCKGVVQAVVNLARERLFTWRGVDHTWKDILREVENLPGSVAALTQQCQRLFRALKEAQLTKMDLRRSDPRAMDRACEVLLAWQSRAMSHSNAVHELIIRKVVNWPRLGAFDFTDLDICLRLVDRRESDSEVFLSRVKALVEDENTAPKDLRGLLSHVETMLFFLKYAKSEDLQKTYAEFHKQYPKLTPAVVEFLQAAERDYPPGSELVAFSDNRNLLNGQDVNTVLDEIRKPKSTTWNRKDGLGIFREIFYQWALAMRSKFNLLVLPHHTQVVCLLAFRRFLEAVGQQPKQAAAGVPPFPRALIAQVGTGEGKSMIVAAMAIYVVVALRKKAHIVVDDETLLERDFWTFKPLFDIFEVPVADATPGTARTRPPRKRSISAVLCVSEERLQSAGSGEASRSMAARVDPDADICYCEAKHVQSFYASIARGEKRDFEGYDGRVLILDEVDALVIDEEPNEAFVYPNPELSKMATAVAGALKQGQRDLAGVYPTQHPAASRVVSIMSKEWEKAKQLVSGEDFVYGKEIGRYCSLQSGRANAKSWSLALECRNYQDGFSREILFQERLFVMSRPRVFRRYHCILGLSGSIGSEPERKFLQDTYRASFFEVPAFLKTCRDAPFHEAIPRPYGEKQQMLYVESTFDAQAARVAEVCMEARERVPVLVIAKDRGHADQLVEYLHQAARSHGLGRVADDMVRSLSRTVYEADPEQWKENLNRSTMPLGESGAGHQSWRITVTDPRGGRGTDYRVDDLEVDANGGLLLVPTIVPTSQREWIQFLGRTARQDRRGQYCTVLCAADYEAQRAKYGGSLLSGSLDTIKAILAWGDLETAGRIQSCAALYNNGVRMNELCEDLFSRRTDLLNDISARELIVDVCGRHRWMSVREVDAAFARLPGFEPAKVPTEARDLGRPAEPPIGPGQSVNVPIGNMATANGVGAPASAEVPRTVIFCLDWSTSMLSRDTRTPYTRFELCVRCVQQILQNQVRDCDLVGVVCFGPQVTTVVPPTPKGQGGQMIRAKIAGLRPQASGGTCFFDAVAQCLQVLGTPGITDAQAQRWLICLTDGDDLGSRLQNSAGQLVTQMLQTSIPPHLNMVMITVGALRAANTRVISSWVERVRAAGGHGQLLSEKDAGAITMAFQVVAEALAMEVGGATEC